MPDNTAGFDFAGKLQTALTRIYQVVREKGNRSKPRWYASELGIEALTEALSGCKFTERPKYLYGHRLVIDNSLAQNIIELRNRHQTLILEIPLAAN